jgi:hypothetical protein
MSDIV